MCPPSPTTFPDWQNQQQADPDFVVAGGTLRVPGNVVENIDAISSSMLGL